MAERLDTLERRQSGALQRLEERQSAAVDSMAAAASRLRTAWLVALGGVVLAAAALVVALVR
jgi:hypothetical protein